MNTKPVSGLRLTIETLNYGYTDRPTIKSDAGLSRTPRQHATDGTDYKCCCIRSCVSLSVEWFWWLELRRTDVAAVRVFLWNYKYRCYVVTAPYVCRINHCHRIGRVRAAVYCSANAAEGGFNVGRLCGLPLTSMSSMLVSYRQKYKGLASSILSRAKAFNWFYDQCQLFDY